MNEEWNESTAPVDVPVVEAANSDEAPGPNRVSLPSIDAPAACSAVPGWCSLQHRSRWRPATGPRATPIVRQDRVALPLVPTIRPKV